MKYYPHIDGLRAVAVLSVLFFHLDINVFKGGYVGVDIFFVISGFLISMIITNEIKATGTFSFSQFYIRRVRRLFPALFATVFVCSIVAPLIFTSSYLRSFGLEMLASTFSFSNFYFWNESGYFANASETKAFLHTWSLSVEEQFYLFFPLFLVLLYKIKTKFLFILILLTVFFSSLLLNIYVLDNEITWFKNQSSSVFFLMPFRVFEFFLGVFSFYIITRLKANQIVHELFFIVGLLLIGYSVFFFDSSIPFPHIYALIPCIGTALIILANKSMLTSFILERKLMVGIGLISYSLYLTHWPIIVFYKFANLIELTLTDKVFLLIIIIVTSILLYFQVEKRFRKRSHQIFRPRWNILFNKFIIASMLLISVVGASYLKSDGLEKYKNEIFNSTAISKGKIKRYKYRNKSCQLSEYTSNKCFPNREKQILFIGNSHVIDGYNSFQYIFGEDESINLIIFGSTNNCQIRVSSSNEIISSSKNERCISRLEFLNQLSFMKSLDYVIYSVNKPFEKDKIGHWNSLSYLQSINPNLKIIILGTYFNTVKMCHEIANQFDSIEACKSLKAISYSGIDEYKKVDHFQKKYNLNFLFLDKFKVLCSPSRTLESCKVSISNVPMFYDKHHLSLEFAQHLGEGYFLHYEDELKRIGLKR